MIKTIRLIEEGKESDVEFLEVNEPKRYISIFRRLDTIIFDDLTKFAKQRAYGEAALQTIKKLIFNREEDIIDCLKNHKEIDLDVTESYITLTIIGEDRIKVLNQVEYMLSELDREEWTEF